MESYLHIKTTFDCVIKSAGFEKCLKKNNVYSFLTKSSDTNIFFYPLDSKCYLPFCFHLEDKTICGSSNVKVVSMQNNNVYLIVSPIKFLTNVFETKHKQISLSNTIHNIYYPENSRFCVKILCENSSLEVNEEQIISKATILTNSNSILLYAQIENTTKHMILIVEYSGKSYIIKKCEKVDELEKDQNFITTYKKQNDTADHAVVSSYEIKNNFYETIKVVYNSNHPFITKHIGIIPLAFLEAIKLKNYKLARVYMSKTLGNKLNNNHLKTFFSDFVDIIKPPFENENSIEYMLTYSNNSNQNTFFAKNFAFIFDENNKISNIEEE